MPDEAPDVSIVICTYNREELLRDCLRSLTSQSAEMSRIPVVVVDNNSTDATAQIVREFERQLPELRYVFEAEQGISHARNRGFREADTRWVAFLDDDARAFSDYFENVERAIRRDEFDCIGGAYVPWYRDGRPKWYLDSYGANAGKPAGVLQNDYASAGNLIVKRDVLERLGGFSNPLGMSGEVVAYGEETRLQVIMRREGLVIGFDPEIRVEHLVPVYKQTPLWFMRASFAQGRGSWDIFLYDRTFKRIGKEMLWGVIQFFKNVVSGFWRLTSKQDYYIQNWLIDSTRPISFSLGAVIGFVEPVFSRRVGR